LAPSGTFGAVTVSAGASDADFPSSALADSDCAATVPTQSDVANAAPATTATACVNFIPDLPSGSTGEPVSLMHSRRIVHQQTARPEANSAPVYEENPTEVSRDAKSADRGQAPNWLALFCATCTKRRRKAVQAAR
jgi:hypothetical protein